MSKTFSSDIISFSFKYSFHARRAFLRSHRRHQATANVLSAYLPSLLLVVSQLVWLQIPVLVESGYRVLAPDLKGFGQSDKPQDLQLYTMPNLLKDVLGILDQLQVTRVHCVVGHDWGAALAWQLAGRFPDRFERLVALSVGHNASMFSMGGNQQREKSWYMLFFKVHIHVLLP